MSISSWKAWFYLRSHRPPRPCSRHPGWRWWCVATSSQHRGTWRSLPAPSSQRLCPYPSWLQTLVLVLHRCLLGPVICHPSPSYSSQGQSGTAARCYHTYMWQQELHQTEGRCSDNYLHHTSYRGMSVSECMTPVRSGRSRVHVADHLQFQRWNDWRHRGRWSRPRLTNAVSSSTWWKISHPLTSARSFCHWKNR